VLSFWEIFERDAEGPSEMAPESETRRDSGSSEKDDTVESC
jgi:hypothetical protein